MITNKSEALKAIKDELLKICADKEAEQALLDKLSMPWYDLSLSEIDEYYDDNLNLRECGCTSREVKFIALSDELKNDKKFISEVKELMSYMEVDNVSYILSKMLGIVENKKVFNR